MLRNKINTFKAYQIITRFTNRKMVTFGKFTNSRNNICYHVFINAEFNLQMQQNSD